MNNYWVGVICGCCVASLFFVVMMFVNIEQTNSLRCEVGKLRDEVKELKSESAEHEDILNYFGWLKSNTNNE